MFCVSFFPLTFLFIFLGWIVAAFLHFVTIAENLPALFDAFRHVPVLSLRVSRISLGPGLPGTAKIWSFGPSIIIDSIFGHPGDTKLLNTPGP